MSLPESEQENKELVKLFFQVVWGCVVTIIHLFCDLFEVFFPGPGKSIKGKHVLVTGAARGLGREIALRFAREGCLVSCVDVDSVGCAETAKLVNELAADKGHAYTYDITERSAVARLHKEVPDVDILVNNAGIVAAASILDVADSSIEKMIQVNLVSHFWMIRTFLPGMQERKSGHIVAISSAAAFTAAANIVPYTATKYGVTGLMASLREELRRTTPEIKTTCVHPFFIAPASVKHWEIKSRLPDVTAAYVAAKAVEGVKRDKDSISVPGYMSALMHLLRGLPTSSGDLWRDMFYAKIDQKQKDR